jgi:uncharacterized delta-60 repeat protein
MRVVTLLALLCVSAATAAQFNGFFQARSQSLADGRRILLGTVAHPGDPVFYDFAVGRVLPDGSPDLTFNGTGLAVLPVWGDYEFATAMALQNDGKLVIAGVVGDPARPISCDFLNCDAYIAVVRLNFNGTVDPTFNGGQRLILQIGPVGPTIDQTGADRTLDSVGFAADGKIVLLGPVSIGSPGLARINTDGTLDTSYSPPKYAVSTVTWVPIIEYYIASLDHYFVTADRGESAAIDQGLFGPWKRTRQAFHATVAQNPNPIGVPVCRLYGRPEFGLNTHFYTANLDECNFLVTSSGGAWKLESTDVFRITIPDKATGACPAGMMPIYRLWNGKIPDVNHRFTTSREIRDQMVARGYQREGYGPPPNEVSMCAAP